MTPSRLLGVGRLLTFAAASSRWSPGTPPAAPAAAKLPLTRVVLFTAGVGYFHREGTVDGTARVELKVPEEDVNDLIKTLVAADKDGGTARAVTYDNKAPAEVDPQGVRRGPDREPVRRPTARPGPRGGRWNSPTGAGPSSPAPWSASSGRRRRSRQRIAVRDRRVRRTGGRAAARPPPGRRSSPAPRSRPTPSPR